MKTVDISAATGPLGDYARKARREAVVITRRGRPVAALVPVESADLESLSLATNSDFLGIIERSRARCKPGTGISTEEMRRRLTARRKAG